MLRWSTVIYTHLWWSCFFGHQTQAAKLERNSCLTKHSHSFDNSAIILLHSTMHGELFPTKAVPTRENWVKLKFLSELGRVTDRVHYVSLRLHACKKLLQKDAESQPFQIYLRHYLCLHSAHIIFQEIFNMVYYVLNVNICNCLFSIKLFELFIGRDSWIKGSKIVF